MITKGIVLMVLSATFAAVGQLLWKLSFGAIHIYLFLGFALYGIGALLMLQAYKYGELSVLQPILSIGYCLSLFLGYVVLGEVLSVEKIMGTILIILGVVLISRREKS